MNTIRDRISNWLSAFPYRNERYGISSEFRVIEVRDNLPAETQDWSIHHGNFGKTGFTGKGERVAVLDTGVDANHRELRGQVDAFCFIDGCKDNPTYMDSSGHGCVNGNARIINSFSGMSSIEDFYNHIDLREFKNDNLTDAYSKDISKLNINTLSLVGDKIEKRKITHVHKFNICEELFEVDFGVSKVLLTPWHPTYIITSSRGRKKTIAKKPADKLNIGDKVVLNNCFRSIGEQEIYVNGHLLDEDMAWLAGIIFTDGHLVDAKKHNNNYVIMISQSVDNKSILLRCSEIIKYKFGYESVIVKDDRSKCLTLKASNKQAWTFFNSFGIPFGDKSKSINLPNIITRGTAKVIESFIAGLIDGDGSVSKKDGRVRIITGSYTFADNFKIWTNSVGIRSSYSTIVDTRSRFGGISTYYQIRLQITEGIASKIFTERKRNACSSLLHDKNLTARSIVNIKRVVFNGNMFDLTVEKSHNYLAEGMIISNTFCTSQIVSKRDGFGIIGVAPEASCFAGRVLYGDGRDRGMYRFEYFLANAINAAVNDGCGVISMSLGSPHKSPIIGKAVDAAVEKGVLLFAAAGNEGMSGSPYKSYPAAFENVISVGSSSALDLPHWYTTSGIGNNRLEQPEASISSVEYYWGCLPGNKYGKMTGTSQACPTLAGVALLWRQAMREKNILPIGKDVLKEFREWLRKNTVDTNNNGWDNILGYGVLKLKNGLIME